MNKRAIHHQSGMVEFLPDPRVEARRILDEYGLDAIVHLIGRVRELEQANARSGAGCSVNIGAEKHPIEAAFERLAAQQAAVEARLRQGGNHAP